MQDKLVWSGRPSQWLNARPFFGGTVFLIVMGVLQSAGFFDVLFTEYAPNLMHLKPVFKTALFLLPVLWMAWSWLTVHLHIYELTDEVFREHSGVLNRVTHELELYRVIDTLTYKPFELNIMRLGNVIMNTSDASDPVIYILAVPKPDEIRKLIRHHVEQQRARKGIVEVANR
jgi:hypothetical protein